MVPIDWQGMTSYSCSIKTYLRSMGETVVGTIIPKQKKNNNNDNMKYSMSHLLLRDTAKNELRSKPETKPYREMSLFLQTPKFQSRYRVAEGSLCAENQLDRFNRIRACDTVGQTSHIPQQAYAHAAVRRAVKLYRQLSISIACGFRLSGRPPRRCMRSH